jgi:hypothetical protein
MPNLVNGPADKDCAGNHGIELPPGESGVARILHWQSLRLHRLLSCLPICVLHPIDHGAANKPMIQPINPKSCEFVGYILAQQLCRDQ